MEYIFIFVVGFISAILFLIIVKLIRDYIYKHDKKRKKEEFCKKMKDLEIK